MSEMLSWQSPLPRLAVPSQAEMLDWQKRAQSLDEVHEVGMLSRQMFLLSHAMVAGMLTWEKLLMKLVEGIGKWRLRSAGILQSLAEEIEHGIVIWRRL